MPSREQLVTETLVRLADTLVSDHDPYELFYRLVESCRTVLEVDQAGLMLKEPSGGLQVVAATSESTHMIELLQIQNAEGPCLDAVRSGAPVITGALSDPAATERWPRLTAAALDAGFTAIAALPMRLRDQVLGALNLFFAGDRRPLGEDISVAQAFADIGTISILQDRAALDARHVIDRLQGALDSRVVIEQAKGRVAQHLKQDVHAAFASIRRYARNRNLHLSVVTAQIVDGSIDPSDLVDG